jgi:hypothetical protein
MTMLTSVFFIAACVCFVVVALVGLLIYWDARETKQTAEERAKRQEFYRTIYTSDVIKEKSH